jgi:signal transduction histidine kinase
VGVYGVKKLQFRQAEPGSEITRLINQMDPRAPESLPPNRRGVVGWDRSGLRLADAQVVRSGPERDLTLVLADTSHEAHVDWITPKDKSFRVRPGTPVVFEWEEFYSIGVAGKATASYEKLSSGLYRFRMGSLDVMGVPGDIEASVPVEVAVGFWQTSWFWIGTLVGLAGLVIGAWRLSEWRQVKRQVAAIERTRAVEQERFRIAQDIHDDLGAQVTQISLVSSAAQKMPGLSDEARKQFGSVSQMSRSLVEALYETVWAVSPENDHLDSLVTYICKVANQMCIQAGLKCRLQIPDLPGDTPVTSGIRHNLVMIMKEAIHNVIKHAEATEVNISIGLEAQLFTIEVADDGKGFDATAKPRGNGLANMKQRLAAVGGRCLQHSEIGVGTRIRLELTLPEMSGPSRPPAAKPSSTDLNNAH